MNKKQLSRVLREWTGEHTVASSWLSAATCFEFEVGKVVRIKKVTEVIEGLILDSWRVDDCEPVTGWAELRLRRFNSKEEALGALIEYLDKKLEDESH